MTRLLLGTALATLALAVAAPAQAAPGAIGDTAGTHAQPRSGDTLKYGDLLKAIAAHNVAKASFSSRDDVVDVTLDDGSQHLVGLLDNSEQRLAESLVASGAEVEVDGDVARGDGAGLGTVLQIVGVLMLLTLAGVLILRRGRRHAQSAGDANARPRGLRGPRRGAKNSSAARVTTVSFADVAGCDEAVEEVSELVTFLREPERFKTVGAKMPSGVILYGPPGTGKTLLAKALAGEAGVPFFAASGSDFVEKYVGVGAKRVRELFAKARRCENGAVVFIDEIDAVGTKRSGGDGGNRESDNTLNQLLAELDGFHSRAGVVVVGATNRLDTLDAALLRPGRFSRQIQVSTPDEAGRLEIMRIHSKGKPFAPDVDLARLAHITAGNSGAELAELINEAAIWTARDGRTEITDADLWEGLCRVIAGPRKASSMLAEGERDIVAYHEAGHVLAGELCPTQDRTEHATINPRGRALGFALKGRTDRGLHSEQFLHESLIFVLGGRAAEYVHFGTVSSGAANDLQQANLTARTAIEEWGLSALVGQLSSGAGRFSSATAAKIDEEVARLVGEAYSDAVDLIASHDDQLERIAGALLASGDIDRPEIELAMRGALIAPRPPRQTHAPAPDHVTTPASAPPPRRGSDADRSAEPSDEAAGGSWRGRLRRPALAGAGRALAALAQRAPLRRRADSQD